MILKNKNGADKILSVYWFAVLVIIAGAIVLMVFMFYNYPYNVRNVEGNIMINKIGDCISDNGKLNSNLFNVTGFRNDFVISKECNLNFKTENIFPQDEIQYYSEINFYSLDSDISLNKIQDGNKNLIADCNTDPTKKYGKLVECVNKSFYSVGIDNSPYKINILSIVRKSEKNIKA